LELLSVIKLETRSIQRRNKSVFLPGKRKMARKIHIRLQSLTSLHQVKGLDAGIILLQ